ncbi:MAG: hypothetical protein J0J05_12445 [Microbacterium sp.]|uniref:hypothetical protein n=1 Tax=Microbacterium sp. TaxID=51671 RepID=UPI001ACBDDFB|nr:hypothetical protein [Microbacterium sp.]MBN9154782.1 hypothetical protein [Microbacterium sp.]
MVVLDSLAFSTIYAFLFQNAYGTSATLAERFTGFWGQFAAVAFFGIVPAAIAISIEFFGSRATLLRAVIAATVAGLLWGGGVGLVLWFGGLRGYALAGGLLCVLVVITFAPLLVVSGRTRRVPSAEQSV